MNYLKGSKVQSWLHWILSSASQWECNFSTVWPLLHVDYLFHHQCHRSTSHVTKCLIFVTLSQTYCDYKTLLNKPNRLSYSLSLTKYYRCLLFWRENQTILLIYILITSYLVIIEKVTLTSLDCRRPFLFHTSNLHWLIRLWLTRLWICLTNLKFM